MKFKFFICVIASAICMVNYSFAQGASTDGSSYESPNQVDDQCAHLLGPQRMPPPEGNDHIWYAPNGLIVIEAENVHEIIENWSLQNALSGALSHGYIEWKHGNPATGTDDPGLGIQTYYFVAEVPGVYRFLFRTAAPHKTDHNDVWVRFPHDTVEARRPGGSDAINIDPDTWFKVYQNKGDNLWNFDTFTIDNDPHEVFVTVTDDVFFHAVELSGRSTQFKIDRLVLFNEEVGEGEATNLSTPESICSTLPVELIRFDGLVNGNEVLLSWATASETNNAGFEIEFGSQGIYEKIGFVAGAGTSTETVTYHFVHTIPDFSGHNVSYRLKQIDFDGAFEYSDSITLSLRLTNKLILHPAYPNPFNPATTISFTLPVESEVKISVYDITGRLVSELLNEVKPAGFHQVQFHATENTTNGLYAYRIETPNQIENGKLILLK